MIASHASVKSGCETMKLHSGTANNSIVHAVKTKPLRPERAKKLGLEPGKPNRVTASLLVRTTSGCPVRDGAAPRASSSPVRSQQRAEQRERHALAHGFTHRVTLHVRVRAGGTDYVDVLALKALREQQPGQTPPSQGRHKVLSPPWELTQPEGPPLSSFCQEGRPRSLQGQQKGINHARI